MVLHSHAAHTTHTTHAAARAGVHLFLRASLHVFQLIRDERRHQQVDQEGRRQTKVQQAPENPARE